MDDLILADLQERIADGDAERLAAWRRESPTNEARYQELARVWWLGGRRDPLAFGGRAPTLDELVRRTGATPRRSAQIRRMAWRRGALTSAMIAAAAVLAFVTVARWDAPERALHVGDANGLSASELFTDTAELATARLDDGSVVRLAPRSRLRVTPIADRREVWLDGQAFFAIARDTARPFTVRTRNGNVEVLGTRFDLRVEGTQLRLVVTDGVVELNAGGRRERVTAGHMAVVDAGVQPTVSPIANPDSVIDWTRGFIVFQDTPLRQAAVELERRYGLQILLPDSALADRTVTAWFTHQSVDQVLDVVCRAVDAHCTRRGNVASIEP